MARRGFVASRFPGFATIAILVFAAIYTPIITVVAYSFNSGESIAIWEGFSFRWYPIAWNDEAVREVTLRSLAIASVAAVVGTLAATMAALGTTRQRRTRGRTLIYLMINQP